MNDATEFESSLAGTIDFFQNLRRKVGVLERTPARNTTVTRRSPLRWPPSSTLARADRQTLAALAGNFETQTAQLVKLQTDVRLLDEELAQLETLAGGLPEQDQEQARQTLAQTLEEVRTQAHGLRQRWKRI